MYCCVMFDTELNTPERAKVELKLRGHSYRSAAKQIGKSYQWICEVLNGHKKSRPVINAIFELSIRHKPDAAGQGGVRGMIDSTPGHLVPTRK